MIAVSDAVLVLVSATALVAGLYRWQSNLEYVPERAPSVQSSSSTSSSSNNTDENAGNQDTSVQSSQNTSELGTQADVETSRVLVVQPEQTRSIDVNQDSETSAANQAIGDAPSLATYTIVPGDNLGRLADRFGTSVRVLQEINGIQGSLIQVGQQIRYPLPAN